MEIEDIQDSICVIILQLKELQRQLWDHPLTWEQKNQLEAAITNLIEIDKVLTDEDI